MLCCVLGSALHQTIPVFFVATFYNLTQRPPHNCILSVPFCFLCVHCYMTRAFTAVMSAADGTLNAYVRTAMCPEKPGTTVSVVGYCSDANHTSLE